MTSGDDTQQWLRRSLEATGLGKWQYNLLTGIIRLDERARSHFGFDTETVTIEQLLGQIAEEDRDRITHEIQVATSPGGSGYHATECRFIHPDGSKHWLHLLSRVIFDVNAKQSPVMGFGTSEDITQRKRFEADGKKAHASLEQRVQERTIELQRTNARVEAILTHTADAVLLVNYNLRVQQVNPAFERLFQYEAKNFVNHSLLELLPTHEHDAAFKLIYEHGPESNSHTLEVKAVRQDKSVFDAELNLGTMQDSDLVCIVRDITERKKAQQLLENKLNEEKAFHQGLMALHEVSLDLSGIADLDTFYSEAVRLGREKLGFDRVGLILYDAEHNQAVGTYGTDIHGHHHDERHIRFAPGDTSGILMRAVEKTERFSYEINTQLFTGLERVGTGWNAAAVMWNAGQVLGWLVTDNALSGQPANRAMLEIQAQYSITLGTLLSQKRSQAELRESEARYRLLADNSNDLILRIDPIGNYQYVSPSSRTILGYEPEEMIGHSGFEFLHPEDLEPLQIALYEATQNPAPPSPQIYRLRHKAGHYIWIESYSRNVLSETTGEVLGFIAISRDITARREQEAALMRSTNEIEDLYNRAPVGYHSLDKDGVFIQINDTELNWMGYGREEVVGKMRLSDILTPKSAAQFAHNFPVFKTRGWSRDVEYEVIRKDGSILPVLLSATAHYNERGEYLHSRATFYDMTEIKKTQRALRESEARYRMLAENITDIVAQTAMDGQCLYISPSVRLVLGYSVEEFMTLQPGELLHPDEAESVFKTYEDGFNMPFPLISITYRMRHKEGHYIWLETIARPYYSLQTHQLEGLVSSSRDVTDRKRISAELERERAFLRKVIDVSPSLIFVKDYDSRFMLANLQMAAIRNRTSEQLVGTRTTDFNSPIKEITLFTETDQQVIETGEPIYFESEVTHADGTVHWYQTNKVPILFDDSDMRYALAIATDITEQKAAEQTLRQALEREKELGELKSRFVSMASHEFRTPLATILALSETLLAYRPKLSDTQIDQKLIKIQEQITYLKAVMEDVLLLARMQARRVGFEPRDIDLDALCRAVLEEFPNRIIRYNCDERLKNAYLDKILIHKIINNLLSNAIKYSSSSTVVHFQLHMRDNGVEIMVQDEGIGIPDADLPHLFEPFHRANNVGTVSGTGLGLVITREAVELHGGTITLSSKINAGTCFKVFIPFAHSKETEKHSGVE